MSCVSLGYSTSVCGNFGTCVNETLCLCNNDALTQNSEWFFFLKQEASETQNLPCYSNENVVRSLYFLIGLFGAASFILGAVHFYIVKHSKPRHFVTYTFCLLNALLGFVRFSDETRLLGQDTLFTVLMGVNYGLGGWRAAQYNTRFLDFHLEKLLTLRRNKKAFRRIQVARHSSDIIAFWYIVFGSSIFLSTIFVPRELGYVLLVTLFAVNGCFALFHGILNHIIMTWFIKDLKFMIRDRGGSHVMQTGANAKFLKTLERALKKMGRNRASTDYFNILAFVVSCVAATMMPLNLYLTPLITLNMGFLTLQSLFSSVKSRLEPKEKTVVSSSVRTTSKFGSSILLDNNANI